MRNTMSNIRLLFSLLVTELILTSCASPIPQQNTKPPVANQPSSLPLSQPSDSPLPTSIPQPTGTPSSSPVSSPSSLQPVPNSVHSYPSEPTYIDTSPISPLFLSNRSEDTTSIIWRTDKGGIKYLNYWDDNLFSIKEPNTILDQKSQPAIFFPDLIMGVLSNHQNMLFILRDLSSTNELINANPIKTHTINTEGSTVKNYKFYDLLSAQAMGVSSEGAGYLIMSDEHPPRGGKPSLDKSSINIYASRIDSYTVQEPKQIFSTLATNLTGHVLVKSAAVNPEGSGHIVYFSANDSTYYYQNFTNLRPDGQPQKIKIGLSDNLGNLRFSYRMNGGNGSLWWLNVLDGKPTLFFKPIRNYKLSDESYSMPITVQASSISIQFGIYTNIGLAVQIDENGNGLIVTKIKHDSENQDHLIFQKVGDYKTTQIQEYVPTQNKPIVDIKLELNKQGNGKLFFIDGNCAESTGCSGTNVDNRMRVGYLAIENFALE